MRIYLQLSRSKELIPFNHQLYLTGAIHKWLGDNNEVHDSPSLYCFSWIQSVDTFRNGIKTKAGSYFFIGAHDEAIIKKIAKGILADPSVCFGVNVTEIQIAEPPVFSEKEVFYTASPVFIKRRIEQAEKHIEHNHPASAQYLTETLQKKLMLAGLSGEGVKVAFDKSYHSPRTKIIHYKKIGNRVNICPVIIEGSPEQLAFAWNVGVGNSTGIGFGALK